MSVSHTRSFFGDAPHAGSFGLKTRSRKYPGLVHSMRSSRRRPAHATHPPRAAARPRQTSHRQQAPPPPPPAPPPSPPRLPPPATSRRIPLHLQACTVFMPPPTFWLAACKHLQYLLEKKRNGRATQARHTRAQHEQALEEKRRAGQSRPAPNSTPRAPSPSTSTAAAASATLAISPTRANRLAARRVRHVYWPRTAATHGQPTP